MFKNLQVSEVIASVRDRNVDMSNITNQLDYLRSMKSQDIVIDRKQVNSLYKEIKNQTISDMNISYNNLMEIKVKAMNTLKMLMAGLLLMPEFEIIYSGQK